MSTETLPPRPSSVSSHAAPSEAGSQREVTPEPSKAADESERSTEQAESAEDEPEVALKMAMMGMGLRVTPSAMPPSSPPLTPHEPDGRQEHVVVRTPDSEMDITNLRASWVEDDIGSSSSKASSKDVPSADDAVHMAFGSGEPSKRRQSPRRTQEHPLRLDIHPPSPPPWEQIDPPLSNGPNDPYGSSNTRIHQFSSTKPLRSRPLIPYSSYYFGPPPRDAAFGTPPVGQIGVHHPREVIRIERDYSGGELPQFAPVYPLEFEGRITPTKFLETINDINELLISAHSLQHSFVDNALSFLTFQASRLVKTSHYEKEMRRLQRLIEDRNAQLYNPAGLNILWPRKVAFMFLEVEYY